MLSAGQYPGFEMNHAAEKYAKFAYSTDFGFSVSAGSYNIEKLGLDNMLYLSECDNYWRPRRHTESRFSSDEQLYSVWHPFNDVDVHTWILPAGDWHVRIHRIVSGRNLDMVEGGFGLNRYQGFDNYEKETALRGEDGYSIIVKTKWGITAIEDLTSSCKTDYIYSMPNTNLVYSTQMVPIVRSSVAKGNERYLAVLVGASLERNECGNVLETKPVVEISADYRNVVINSKTIELYQK